MDIIQIADVLRRYGVDALLLALGVTVLTSLLKKTVMKSVNKKAFVFLPFALGIVVYFVYMLSTKGGVCFTAEEIGAIFDGGFKTGSAATLYYVLYEQFLRGRFKTDPLAPLLACIPKENRDKAAEELMTKCKEAESAYDCAKEILLAYADPPLSDGELDATAALLAKYIEQIT